jgi:hypothetical protein
METQDAAIVALASEPARPSYAWRTGHHAKAKNGDRWPCSLRGISTTQSRAPRKTLRWDACSYGISDPGRGRDRGPAHDVHDLGRRRRRQGRGVHGSVCAGGQRRGAASDTLRDDRRARGLLARLLAPTVGRAVGYPGSLPKNARRAALRRVWRGYSTASVSSVFV